MSVAAALLLSLIARDTCRYIQTQPGDSCWSLAKRCTISELDFDKFNPAPFSCKSVQIGDSVCCSSGALPNFSPQRQADGHCASYTVQSGDTCSSIATAHQIKESHILEDYNKQTWAWAGCTSIQVGQKICLSDGTPPFPANVKSATCGPQVAGTVQPKGMAPKDWTNLNPCPLTACCNVWGQCGISDEFCTPTSVGSGAPGTAKAGTNGCISNCGTNIANNGKRQDDPKRIGYFEAWNTNRSCMHMDISQVNTDRYTHVHFAFGNLSAGWIPDISGAQQEFEGFKQLTTTKKILSFGGWAFSTDPSTYNIFRTGVQPANRQTFADNVVKFVKQNALDGVDFDWEYPGAQDIPGIPPDSLYSGPNYLEFLKLVKAGLDPKQTVSIAAPASYWYLKGFPIKDIGAVVDYIVYMTYDLHGQWDYGNKYVNPGCPGGNCLRHQANETEVENALAMITKAGVPASRVVVGMAMYGRSFKMTKSGCSSPNCTFVGPESAATPGRCTKTPGYISNSEIYEVIDEAKKHGWKLQQYYDGGDILVYNDTEWVSWLTPSTYAARQASTNAFNFAGTSDWAIDLNGTQTDSASPITDDGFAPENWEICDYSKTFANLDDLKAQAGNLRKDCVNAYTLQVLMDMLDVAYDNYTNVNNGYDDMFEYYTKYMKKLVPGVVAQGFMFNKSATAQYTTHVQLGPGMKYFDCKLGNGRSIPCTDFNDQQYFDTEITKKTTLTLRDDKGYLGALANVGIDADWVEFGDYSFHHDNVAPHGGRAIKYAFHGFPVENKSMEVPNPKDIITKGLGSIPELQNAMAATYMDILLGQWVDGSTSDAVQAYSTPVFMLIQGIDSMQQAKDLGHKEEKDDEQRKKNFILLIVSVVLMFIPVIGEEVAMAAGFTTIARAIAIAGEAGNAALGIYDTVEDPASAIVNILGMLLGVGTIARATRDGKGIGDVAKLRRDMSGDVVAGMGKLFKDNDDKLQGILKVCKRR